MSLEKTPNIATEALDRPTMEKLDLPPGLNHPPRILILYGSLRPQSFSRKLALEAERVLQQFGAETRVFDPHDLPVLDSVPASHPKVQELRALSLWSEGQVWVSPERHGTVTGVFMNQIDWLPLEEGACARRRPHAGRHAGMRRLAIIQRGQRAARPGALDAHGHDPQPVLGTEGVAGIR
jgi:arsenic resistance protein ArsH